MTNHIEVAIGVLVDDRGDDKWILISRRPDHVALPGYWEFPGGKIEPGETARQSLVREFKEELGVTVCVGQALGSIDYLYEHAAVRLHPFLCSRQSGDPTSIGVAEHRWVRPEDLNGYRFPPANESLISELIGLLKNQQAEAATHSG